MAEPEKDLTMKLPATVRKELEGMDKEIRKAKKAVGTLGSLGMDVIDLKDKLKWAEQVRTTLLTEFS